jgi:DnaJ-class molecular chaperone
MLAYTLVPAGGVRAYRHVTLRPEAVFRGALHKLAADERVAAALGATIEVPTLGGEPVKLKVSPGTPSGRILRVKGRGVTTTKGAGDLLAEVQVAVPGRIPEAALDHLRAFESSMPQENTRAELLEKARSDH